jgi:hypothetical protein
MPRKAALPARHTLSQGRPRASRDAGGPFPEDSALSAEHAGRQGWYNGAHNHAANKTEQDLQQALAQTFRDLPSQYNASCDTTLSRPICQPQESRADSEAAGARPGCNNRDRRTHAMLWNACAGWGGELKQQHNQVLHKVESSHW